MFIWLGFMLILARFLGQKVDADYISSVNSPVFRLFQPEKKVKFCKKIARGVHGGGAKRGFIFNAFFTVLLKCLSSFFK
jgi:hypothetical protein